MMIKDVQSAPNALWRGLFLPSPPSTRSPEFRGLQVQASPYEIQTKVVLVPFIPGPLVYHDTSLIN